MKESIKMKILDPENFRRNKRMKKIIEWLKEWLDMTLVVILGFVVIVVIVLLVGTVEVSLESNRETIVIISITAYPIAGAGEQQFIIQYMHKKQPFTIAVNGEDARDKVLEALGGE